MARREINGAAVREIRALLGITQPDLAARCGITQPSLSNIERGERNASPKVVRALADQLGVSLDAITTVVPDTDPEAEAETEAVAS